MITLAPSSSNTQLANLTGISSLAPGLLTGSISNLEKPVTQAELAELKSRVDAQSLDYQKFLQEHHIDQKVQDNEAAQIFALLKSNHLVEEKFDQNGKLESITLTLPDTLPDLPPTKIVPTDPVPENRSLLGRIWGGVVDVAAKIISVITNTYTEYTEWVVHKDIVQCATMPEALNILDKKYIELRLMQKFLMEKNGQAVFPKDTVTISSIGSAVDDMPPILETNQLTIDQGQTVTLSSSMLNSKAVINFNNTFTLASYGDTKIGWVYELVALLNGNFAFHDDNNSTRIYNPNTGDCVHTFSGDAGATLAVLPNGLLVSRSSDILHIWDPNSGELIRDLKYDGYFGEDRDYAVFPNGKLAVASGKDIIIWDTNTGVCLHVLKGHTAEVYVLASYGDKYLASGGSIDAIGIEDHTVRVWDIESGTCLHVLTGHTNWIISLTFLPDFTLTSGAINDPHVRIWDANSGACLRVLDVSARFILPLANGNLVAAHYAISIWDPKSGKHLQTLNGHTNLIRHLTLLPNGLLASGSDDGTVRVWDMQSGRCLRVLRTDSKAEVYAPPIALQNNIIVSGYCGGDPKKAVKIWQPFYASDSELTYVTSNVQHGRFQLIMNPAIEIGNFTQQQVKDGLVQFIHDGSNIAPNGKIAVSDGITSTSPNNVNITFYPSLPPILFTNQLTIVEPEPPLYSPTSWITVILSAANLNAKDGKFLASKLNFTISSLANGYFARLPDWGTQITSFLQDEINHGLIEFVYTGAGNLPSYAVTVGNGFISSGPYKADITFQRIYFWWKLFGPMLGIGGAIVLLALISKLVEHLKEKRLVLLHPELPSVPAPTAIVTESYLQIEMPSRIISAPLAPPMPSGCVYQFYPEFESEDALAQIKNEYLLRLSKNHWFLLRKAGDCGNLDGESGDSANLCIKFQTTPDEMVIIRNCYHQDLLITPVTILNSSLPGPIGWTVNAADRMGIITKENGHIYFDTKITNISCRDNKDPEQKAFLIDSAIYISVRFEFSLQGARFIYVRTNSYNLVSLIKGHHDRGQELNLVCSLLPQRVPDEFNRLRWETIDQSRRMQIQQQLVHVTTIHKANEELADIMRHLATHQFDRYEITYFHQIVQKVLSYEIGADARIIIDLGAAFFTTHWGEKNSDLYRTFFVNISTFLENIRSAGGFVHSIRNKFFELHADILQILGTLISAVLRENRPEAINLVMGRVKALLETNLVRINTVLWQSFPNNLDQLISNCLSVSDDARCDIAPRLTALLQEGARQERNLAGLPPRIVYLKGAINESHNPSMQRRIEVYSGFGSVNGGINFFTPQAPTLLNERSNLLVSSSLPTHSST
ncbi:MAG: hypothetical protein A2X78_02440 [Gammaproteobacteria bacterium GWE2_37_16]|nr:MAG: hypothetical protein A2X78_02440 [Gammaproteobacteria bacterium GWE2_37_16]